MGFSRQEYWSGLPFPSPGDLPDPGIEPGSPALEADALTSEPPGKPVNTQGDVKTKYVRHFLNVEVESWVDVCGLGLPTVLSSRVWSATFHSFCSVLWSTLPAKLPITSKTHCESVCIFDERSSLICTNEIKLKSQLKDSPSLEGSRYVNGKRKNVIKLKGMF